MVSGQRSTVPLSMVYHFILLLLRFLFSIGFQQFVYNVPQYGFLHVYFTWGLFSILYLWVYSFCRIQKTLAIISSNSIVPTSLLSRAPFIQRLHNWVSPHRWGYCHVIFSVFFFFLSLFWFEYQYLQTHWSFLLQHLLVACCESRPVCFSFQILLKFHLLKFHLWLFISYLTPYLDYDVFLFLLEHMEHILIAILTSFSVNSIISATCG